MFKDNIHCKHFVEPRLNILLSQAEMELNEHQLYNHTLERRKYYLYTNC